MCVSMYVVSYVYEYVYMYFVREATQGPPLTYVYTCACMYVCIYVYTYVCMWLSLGKNKYLGEKHLGGFVLGVFPFYVKKNSANAN